jgi:hypothetical protein
MPLQPRVGHYRHGISHGPIVRKHARLLGFLLRRDVGRDQGSSALSAYKQEGSVVSGVSPELSARLQTDSGDRSAHTHNDRNPFASQVSLRQALRTLRAIRQRYATGREAHPVARFYTVQVALGYADMLWLTATIEALEKSIAGDASDEAADAAAQARPPDISGF